MNKDSNNTSETSNISLDEGCTVLAIKLESSIFAIRKTLEKISADLEDSDKYKYPSVFDDHFYKRLEQYVHRFEDTHPDLACRLDDLLQRNVVED